MADPLSTEAPEFSATNGNRRTTEILEERLEAKTDELQAHFREFRQDLSEIPGEWRRIVQRHPTKSVIAAVIAGLIVARLFSDSRSKRSSPSPDKAGYLLSEDEIADLIEDVVGEVERGHSIDEAVQRGLRRHTPVEPETSSPSWLREAVGELARTLAYTAAQSVWNQMEDQMVGWVEEMINPQR